MLARAVLSAALIGVGLQDGNARTEPVRVEVRQVVVDPVRGTPVVLLAGDGRVLPIWIGEAEAASMARALRGDRLSRPDTHDLILNALKEFDASLERVTVTALRESTYFAVITLQWNRRRVEIDARPSDAIAVALRTGAPIYATPEVLRHGIELDEAETAPQGRVSRVMGLHVQDLTAELARSFAATVDAGALVAHVERGGPAAELGLRRGDVVTRVDGERIRNSRDLLETLRAPLTGQPRSFEIQRDGKFVTIVTNLPSR